MKYVGDRIVYPKRDAGEQGYRIQIPTYHRAAVGIFPGSKLYLVPIPKTKDLIVTPIEPARWGDLWKIEAVLHDKPGAAKSIIDTLVNRGVNILVQEGLSDYDEYGYIAHHLYLVVDLSSYSSKMDGPSNERNTVDKPSARPNHLISEIISKAVDYLHVTYAQDSWNFSFERMNFFFRHKEYRTRGKQQALSGGNEKTHLLYDEGDLRSIVVSDRMLENEFYGGSLPAKLGCHILSDTEEKYIKVRFLREDGRYILIRIQHQERVGVIRKFLEVLKKHNANITNSYNRLASMHEWAWWHAFLEFPAKTKTSAIDSLVRELHAIDEVSALAIRSHHGFADLKVPDLPKFHEAGRLPFIDKLKVAGRMGGVVESSLSSARTSNGNREEENLGVRPFYLGYGWKKQQGNVFVAMAFDPLYDEFYRNHIKPTISECGLVSVRLDEDYPLHPQETMTDMIKRQIATCDFVVADVTGFNGNVLYEVGIAHAIGKAVLIICEDRHKETKGMLFDIQNFRHIFYSPYRTQSFVEIFRQNVEAMARSLRLSDTITGV